MISWEIKTTPHPVFFLNWDLDIMIMHHATSESLFAFTLSVLFCLYLRIKRTQQSLSLSRCLFFKQSHMFTPSKLNIWLSFLLPMEVHTHNYVPRVEHEKAFSGVCPCTCRGCTGVFMCVLSVCVFMLIDTQTAECADSGQVEDWCWETFV